MTASARRRLALGIAAFVPTAAGLLLGLRAAREAVVRGEEELLRSEAHVAVALHGELAAEGDAAPALDRLFGGRWRRTAAVDSLLDRPRVRANGGRRVVRATLYGPDGWTPAGTLEMREGEAAGGDLPAGVLVRGGLVLLLLLALALGVARSRFRSPSTATAPGAAERSSGWPRRGLSAAAAVVVLGAVAWPLWGAGEWARSRLEGATARRMEVAAAALERIPDPAAFAERPGAVTRLTGLPAVIVGPEGEVLRSTMLPGRAEAVAALPSPLPVRVEVDGAPYAVREVGSARLAVVPYDHTRDPRSRMAGWALAGVLLGALPLTLLPLAGWRRRLRENLVGWSFLAPATLHLLVFTLGPLAFAGWLSLHRWSLVEAARPFVGLANYGGLLTDGLFWNAIGNTALFTLHVPVAMAVALGFALLVRQRSGSRWVRAALFLPSITSLVAIAIVWQWMLSDQYGLLNRLLGRVGLGPVGWLTDPDVALWSLMVMYVWLIVGYQMVLFQAGLAAIPEQLYEAARIDGAGPWGRFRHVTLPGLRHTLFFVLVTSVIGSFQVFGAVYVMTEGGPLHSTDVAVFHIYREAWEFLRFGNAAAMSWILFAILFAVTWLHFRLLEHRSAGRPA